MTNMKTSVSGGLDDAAAAFADAWHRTERGEAAHERVHADVAALEQAGSLERADGTVHATADPIRADMRL
jgi:hypothetical protein